MASPQADQLLAAIQLVTQNLSNLTLSLHELSSSLVSYSSDLETKIAAQANQNNIMAHDTPNQFGLMENRLGEVEKDGKIIKEQFSSVVFAVSGKDCNGCGVLTDGSRILTVKHLGFELKGKYRVQNSLSGEELAECVYLSSRIDLAVLQLPPRESRKLVIDALVPGNSFFILGFPHSAQDTFPSVCPVEIIKGLTKDGEFIGVPGSRKGISGGPIFSRNGCFCGMVIGALHDSQNQATEEIKIEQPYVQILPMTTINAELMNL